MKNNDEVDYYVVARRKHGPRIGRDKERRMEIWERAVLDVFEPHPELRNQMLSDAVSRIGCSARSTQTANGGYWTIKPLKWKREFNDYSQTYQSDSAHGGYRVTRHRRDCEEHDRCQIDSHGEWGSWRWEYCFCEYYDELYSDCANAKEGKVAAEAHWRGYLIAGLKPADKTTRRWVA